MAIISSYKQYAEDSVSKPAFIKLFYAEIHEAYQDLVPSYVGIDASVIDTWQGIIIMFNNYLDSDDIAFEPGKLTYERRMKYVYRNIRCHMRRLKCGEVDASSYRYAQRKKMVTTREGKQIIDYF
jgi:hypothetical protein